MNRLATIMELADKSAAMSPEDRHTFVVLILRRLSDTNLFDLRAELEETEILKKMEVRS